MFHTILDRALEAGPANILKLMRIDKINFVTTLYQFNVLNNAETTFGNISSMKQGLKKRNMTQHGIYLKWCEFCIEGKDIVSTSYVHARLSECRNCACMWIVWKLRSEIKTHICLCMLQWRKIIYYMLHWSTTGNWDFHEDYQSLQPIQTSDVYVNYLLKLW